MAIVALRGLGKFRQTLRKGYSVCHRFVRGQQLNDANDIFSVVAHFRTKSAAEKHLKNMGDKRDNHEIISFKVDEEPR